MPMQRRWHVWTRNPQQLCHLNTICQIWTSWHPHKVAISQNHLNIYQHHNLQKVLVEYGKLFDWFLGVYPHQKVHIDFLPGLKLVHQQVYPVPVPHAYQQTLKKTPTHGWYWNHWWILCLQVSMAFFHCCLKGWPIQRNLWPPLS